MSTNINEMKYKITEIFQTVFSSHPSYRASMFCNIRAFIFPGSLFLSMKDV